MRISETNHQPPRKAYVEDAPDADTGNALAVVEVPPEAPPPPPPVFRTALRLFRQTLVGVALGRHLDSAPIWTKYSQRQPGQITLLGYVCEHYQPRHLRGVFLICLLVLLNGEIDLLRICCLLGPLLRYISSFVCTAAVVEIANLRAVKQLFVQGFIDLVVNMAGPDRSVGTARDLGWEFIENEAKMCCAFTTIRVIQTIASFLGGSNVVRGAWREAYHG